MSGIKLGKDESVVTAWAAPSSGPGWSNSPVQYLVREAAGGLEIRWLQPEEQSDAIITLYSVSAACSNAFTRAVERRLMNEPGAEKVRL